MSNELNIRLPESISMAETRGIEYVCQPLVDAAVATERAKYQRLVAAVEGLLEHLEADDREGSIVDEHIRTLRAALADIEAQL